jgi:hypothetical protein
MPCRAEASPALVNDPKSARHLAESGAFERLHERFVDKAGEADQDDNEEVFPYEQVDEEKDDCREEDHAVEKSGEYANPEAGGRGG